MATKILLVEDEPILVSLYTLMLTKDGYAVSTAMDAQRAEERVVLDRPHLILLDLFIPTDEQNAPTDFNLHEPVGFRILRFVKATPSLQQTRVVVLSNLDSDEHKKTATKLGADGYIVKANIDPHDLGDRIETVLRHQHPTSPQDET